MELVDIIYEYIPRRSLIWISRENYHKYHKLLNRTNKNIRFVVRNDFCFLFSMMLRENGKKWSNQSSKKYIYKYVSYANYMDYLMDYCIESNSAKCRSEIINTGYKNKFKKKTKNIRWTN